MESLHMIEERTSRYEETQRFGRRRAPIGSITIIWKKLPPRAMAIVNTASHKQLVAARTRSCPIGSRKCWPHSRHPNPADASRLARSHLRDLAISEAVGSRRVSAGVLKQTHPA